MPAPLLHIGFNVLCAHGGKAMPVAPNPRVLVSGQATVTVGTPHTVVGCPFGPPGNGPCATAQWLTGTVRVTSGGLPLAVLSGSSICTPTATPLVALPTQPPRVLAI